MNRGPTDCTILIVDDEVANLDLLEEFLSADGWGSIVRTHDSRTAIPLFEAHSPDIVLLDLHMPYVDGYDVLREIQARVRPDDFVPVVILTADMMPAARTRALTEGAHDFLTKPLDVVEVRLRVRNLLRTRLSHLEQRSARTAAEAATRAREMVLSVVAHDLRNPLASIAMDAEMTRYLLDPEMHPEQHRSLLHIERTAGRMHELIEDLLEVARLDHGTFSVRTEPIDFGEVLAEAQAMLTPLARNAGARLECAGHEDPRLIAGDRRRLTQVLSNLVGNAIKFTPPGGTIEVFSATLDEELIVSVRDSGPGIPPEQLVHVFDSFWTSGSAGEGLGLGLTIARAIVEAQGGRIWMESTPDVGTTVRFTVPFAGVPATRDGFAPTAGDTAAAR